MILMYLICVLRLGFCSAAKLTSVSKYWFCRQSVVVETIKSFVTKIILDIIVGFMVKLCGIQMLHYAKPTTSLSCGSKQRKHFLLDSSVTLPPCVSVGTVIYS